MIRTKTLGMTLALALIAALMVGGVALAKSGGGGASKEMDLNTAVAGKSINATGTALVEKRDDGVQDFKVNMRARGVNGKTFKVFVTNSRFAGEWFRAGNFRVTLGSGELEIDNDDGLSLARGVRPVLGIQKVVVKNAAGNAVLRGSF